MTTFIHRLVTKKDSNGNYKTELKIEKEIPKEITVKSKKEKNKNPKYQHVKTRIKHSRSNGWKFHVQTITCIDVEGNLVKKEILHRPL